MYSKSQILNGLCWLSSYSTTSYWMCKCFSFNTWH